MAYQSPAMCASEKRCIPAPTTAYRCNGCVSTPQRETTHIQWIMTYLRSRILFTRPASRRWEAFRSNSYEDPTTHFVRHRRRVVVSTHSWCLPYKRRIDRTALPVLRPLSQWCTANYKRWIHKIYEVFKYYSLPQILSWTSLHFFGVMYSQDFFQKTGDLIDLFYERKKIVIKPASQIKF